jgi:phosphoribosyl-AMP cyclohydrolase
MIIELNEFANTPKQKALACVCPILVREQDVDVVIASFRPKSVWAKLIDPEMLVPLLNKGVDVVVMDYELHIAQLASEDMAKLLHGVSASRLALNLQSSNSLEDKHFLFEFFHTIIVADSAEFAMTSKVISRLVMKVCDMQDAKSIKADKKLTLLNESILSDDMGNFTELLLTNVTSDRQDGLYPTIVVDEQKVALGLCYSSADSILESLRTMTGVYFSRKRGLWYKGASSGATQIIRQIDLDCDSDTFSFTVSQKDPGWSC